MKFGDKLTQLRRRNGLSQEELGEKLNVTRQTVSKWELGQSKPDTDKLIELSKLLNVDFNQLIDDTITIEEKKVNVSINADEVRPRKWLLVLLIIVAIIIVIILANKFVMDKKAQEEANKNFIFDFFGGFIELFDSNNSGDSSFNRTFEIKSGTKLGASVSSLLDDVITNNKKNKEHLITVVFGDLNSNDSNKIKDAKKNVDTFTSYEVSLDYDEDGYINLITIETLDNETNNNLMDDFNNDINKDKFNRDFEFYSGTQYGTPVSMLLDKVITNNKKNSNNIIRVVYSSTDTIDESEIRNIKKNIDIWTSYEIILDYDEDGYVSKITIED